MRTCDRHAHREEEGVLEAVVVSSVRGNAFQPPHQNPKIESEGSSVFPLSAVDLGLPAQSRNCCHLTSEKPEGSSTVATNQVRSTPSIDFLSSVGFSLARRIQHHRQSSIRTAFKMSDPKIQCVASILARWING